MPAKGATALASSLALDAMGVSGLRMEDDLQTCLSTPFFLPESLDVMMARRNVVLELGT